MREIPPATATDLHKLGAVRRGTHLVTAPALLHALPRPVREHLDR